ncbi:hypothetical protein A2738_01050 [Candidatus Nomurabacteria bacterium RIFCSPHIGHO2_01_FULL_42_15]|uniref:Uncharacterized protein n=1 Tax=Candidatus Nomurabacteria bacterium RIFCSPHIGHO2_01_FULL_42_15 TaxID=1801742 RepID=A0A1F6VFT1_9BACT|nr:MAG: hypothetical protein A2738_01050 [Candidatus Nomurabacteria bacterium RIFCSPHIGHO2_01_FULL_42_15]OGI93121.1 MAG: hypothetical protein A3A99_01120 [Candidatus Nomurabacteria bacterium RIFCSPLOWO2_01_FULL_41_18]
MKQNEKEVTVVADCTSCDGTGLFGFRDKLGVTCWDCEGSGKMSITYTPFIERKLRHEWQITEVCQRSSLSMRLGTPISYKEFLEGKFPETPIEPEIPKD